MASDSEILEFLRAKTKGPTILAPLLAIIALACVLLFIPFWKPYIALSGNALIFETSSLQHLEITFRDQTKIRQYIISKLSLVGNGNEQTEVSTAIAVGTEEKVLPIDNPYYIKIQTQAPQNDYYRVTIFIESPWNPKIEDVAINGKQIRLKDFVLHNLRSQGQYHRIRYIREFVSYYISSLNDTVSNFVLALLCACISALAVKVGQMEYRACCSNKSFKKYLIKFVRVKGLNTEQHRNDAFAKYAAYWAIWEKRFHFFQVLGPAVGFILTVSSLIEALQPSTVVVTDLSPFLVGIHIAMVSTFLGLLLRILALEASRVNGVLLDKMSRQISTQEEPRNSVPTHANETTP